MLNPGGIQLDTSAAVDAAYMIGRRAGCGSAYTSEELADCLRKVDETRLTLAIDTVKKQISVDITSTMSMYSLCRLKRKIRQLYNSTLELIG